MTAFVALLRGVNVGGHRKITSRDLKAACDAAGLDDVQTYLQSGNVVFRAARASAARIEESIREHTGVETKVVLRTAAELQKVVDANPLQVENPSRFIVIFLDRDLPEEDRAKIESLVKDEQVRFARREIYVHYPEGIRDSKVANAKLGVVATARNWNTVTALLRLAEERA